MTRLLRAALAALVLASTSAAVAQDAAMRPVAASAKETKPLAAGDPIPDLPPMKASDGKTVDLTEVPAGETRVVVFFRGGWCPYCMTHLADVARIQPTLEKGGVPIFAISPDTPDRLATTVGERKLPYTLLSDSTAAAMRAFGVAFAVDEDTKAKYLGYGVDLADWNGTDAWVLPVPSVFVLREGKVVFAHAEPDYTKRLSGAEILKAAGISETGERLADRKKPEMDTMGKPPAGS